MLYHTFRLGCFFNTLSLLLQKKSLIATSLIVALSLFVVVVNYSEKPSFLPPFFGQTFKPHLGYVSIPKQEVRHKHTCAHSGVQLDTDSTIFFDFYCIFIFFCICFSVCLFAAWLTRIISKHTSRDGHHMSFGKKLLETQTSAQCPRGLTDSGLLAMTSELEMIQKGPQSGCLAGVFSSHSLTAAHPNLYGIYFSP